MVRYPLKVHALLERYENFILKQHIFYFTQKNIILPFFLPQLFAMLAINK